MLKRLVVLFLLMYSCSSEEESTLPPEPVKYTLTTAVNPTEGGTITPSSGEYIEGTSVDITATPSAKYDFSDWSGATGSSNKITIVMNSNKIVTANFTEKIPFYLDDNGVTIKAYDWVTTGITGELNGVTYTAVDNTTLQSMIDDNKDITTVVTTLVNTFSFSGKNDFNQDISSWDVSNVTNMQEVFDGAKSFNQDIGNWDVSNVTNFEKMFRDAYRFNQNIGGWDVSSATNMNDFFNGATDFNQPIGNWDVSNVTKMNGVFYSATSFNQDIGNWNVSSVTDMGSMFMNNRDNVKNTSFNQDIGEWNVSNVTDMNNMFNASDAFNQDIGNWDVSNVTNMNRMFMDAEAFNQNLTKWCVTNITDEPYAFSESSALTESNKPIWGTCPD